MLIVGALLLGYGSLSSRWFAFEGDEYSMHLGLVSSEDCSHDDCHRSFHVSELAHIHRASDMLLIGGALLASLAGLAAAVMSVIGGLRSSKRGPAVAIVITTAIGFVCALGFVAMGMLQMRLEHMNIGAFAYFAGALLALVGALLALKANPAPRPMMMGMYPGMMPPMGMQPGFMQQPPQPMTPPCNQCGGQTQLVQQYNKLFCGRCNRYLV